MFKKLLKTIQGQGQGEAAAPVPPALPSDQGLEQARELVAAGNAAEDAGRVQEARPLYERAVALAPQWPGGQLNLGIALEALGDAAGARACYEKVLALEPGHPFGAYNLGKLHYVQGRLREAEPLLREALARKPDFHDAWVLLSNTLDALGDLQGAAGAIEQAVRVNPDSPGALYNQAGILRRLGRVDAAESAVRHAVTLDPQNVDLQSQHALLLLAQGFAAESLLPLRRAIALAPHRFDLRSKELFLLNLIEGLSADEVWNKHRVLGEQLESVVPARAHAPRAPKARLRIGYVSGDLRTHPVALFLLPVLERHDRARFEVFCYSSTAEPDQTTQRLRSLSDRWIDASAWTDAQLTEAVAADGVDILVDLSGHTSQIRLGVFAGKPAPLQLAWLGYLNTSGLTRMDFRLTDARCDPEAIAQPVHTERLLYLPDSQWCYRPFLTVAPAPAAPCEKNGYVTFGSFNNVTKLTPEMALRWGRILQAVPGARLLIADVASERKKAAILDAIVQAGVAAQRVHFAPRTDLQAYYELMNSVDIALDSYPYGGGTTTFDALWMGVPVLTATGAIPASRSAASVLAMLGLEAWIAPDVDSYEALAVQRAADVGTIARLRRSLREQLSASPLMDEPRFVAAFEAALQRAWAAGRA